MMVYLVRHGETDWNKAGKIQGQEDIPLNQCGREEAAETAKALEDVDFEAAFCSPLVRARETAEILVGSRDISLTEDDRLKEIDFGIMEGERISDIVASLSHPCYHFFRCPERYMPPERAESFDRLFERSRQFLEQRLLPLEKKYDKVLVVAHGALLRSMINPLAGIPLKDFWKEKMGNCAVSVLRLEDGSFSLLEQGREYTNLH